MNPSREEEVKNLIKLLKCLEKEHTDLDQHITECIKNKVCDFSEIKEFKKRKLVLKDKILAVKVKLNPDIIA